MRKIKTPLEIMNQLMSEQEKILFNIFYLIAENPASFWVTDDETFLIGQTNERLPMWIWTSGQMGSSTFADIKSVVSERLALNAELSITGDAARIEPILEAIAKEQQVAFRQNVPMIGYYCKKVSNSKKASGQLIHPGREHEPVLAQFITRMVDDLEKRPMREGEAEDFAKDVAGSEDMYLWEDGGAAVAMAMIAHRAGGYARINTVYTDSGCRGKGYAGMLVGELTQKILDENRIPMLYTEQDNVYSNAVYKRIGYQNCGELVQYKFYMA